MKVYELSKKFKMSDKDLVKVLKSLKIQDNKDLNSFTALTVEEAKTVEKHFNDISNKKTTKKKVLQKETVKPQQGEFLIVKKGKTESAETEKKDVSTDVSSSQSDTKSEEKKAVRVSKKVVVRKKIIQPSQNKGTKPVSKQTKNVDTKSADKKNDIGKKVSHPRKTGNEGSKSGPKDALQINKTTPKPKREFKDANKKKDEGWNRRGGKRGRGYGNRDGRYDKRSEKFVNRKKIREIDPYASVPKSIEIMETITVSDIAKKLNIKVGDVIQKLISLGVMATINQVIDAETSEIIAAEFGCVVKVVSLYDETVIEELADNTEDLMFRPPIVTVMGHVDHGKTKLLDSIREANVVATEAGGITQHIGAYEIKIGQGSIVFLDTPGHEAFTSMRARGAKVTDIVILVVAADDGVMPQTIEAINHAKAAEVPIVVAINKIDSPKANPDQVKQQLANFDLSPEEWGGKTIMVEVSALMKTNLSKLLEVILLEAEILDLKANPNRLAIGTIVESKIDIGRGPVATVLVQNGSLKVGDSFVSGVYSGKVRALFNDRGEPLEKATPSIPVEVLGLDGVPEAGDPFNVVDSEKSAKQFAQKRQDLRRINRAKNVKKITLDDLSRQIQQGEVKELKIVLKGDVQGSVEALKDSFEKLSHEEVAVKVIHSSTGAINENDIMLASASNAIIIGFHVRPNSKSMLLAQREHVEIRKHSIIYDAINSIRGALEGMLAPELREEIIGQAEVRELFRVPKIGVIAGCYVTEGKIVRSHKVRLIREGVEIYEGDIQALKRFKDDVSELKENFECGISIQNYQDIKVGDIIECFYIKEITRTLS